MLPFLVEIEGYRARVERTRDGVLHGRVIEINDSITFKATTARMVEPKFASALEAYFTRCKQNGVEPQRPAGRGF
ncbi:MAG TPA: hypothetical protein VHM24_11695 [Gemmatimonadaceae bacterium]|nr:hypothetical protein [Gemmatimonadaceae bacterium]